MRCAHRFHLLTCACVLNGGESTELTFPIHVSIAAPHLRYLRGREKLKKQKKGCYARRGPNVAPSFRITAWIFGLRITVL
jgi:hypothetical protein